MFCHQSHSKASRNSAGHTGKSLLPPSGPPPIQALMTPGMFKASTPDTDPSTRYTENPFAKEVEELLAEYREIDGVSKAEIYGRFRVLHRLEHAVYKWNSKCSFSEDDDQIQAPPHAGGMLRLLQDVQNEHDRLTEMLISMGMTPYMPDWDNMLEDKQESMKTLWRDVIGDKNLKVEDDTDTDHTLKAVGVPNFRTRVHAMNARLMTTSYGRAILDEICHFHSDPIKVSARYTRGERPGVTMSRAPITATSTAKLIHLPSTWTDIESSVCDDTWKTTVSDRLKETEQRINISEAHLRRKAEQKIKKQKGAALPMKEIAPDSTTTEEVPGDDFLSLDVEKETLGPERLHPSFIRYAGHLMFFSELERKGGKWGDDGYDVKDKTWGGNELWKKIIEDRESILRTEHHLPTRQFVHVQHNPIWYRSGVVR
ncbi:hypothetical protein FUAX_48270 (plasmid) [Fulvitalea axinellae]|uniref:Uncharacterized protein n=1 Tax=Fulvitalea axinellae TaxID=1182444 RepID=A0AAU9CT08_9BACT|nr:hypothetical protein FUAX_48270 [Fulvitalea axinellae]